MLRQSYVFIFSIALIFAIVAFQQSFGQTPGTGEAAMMASGFRPIADGAKVELQIADDSDINLRLRDVAELALTRAGYSVVDDRPDFTLRLETERLLGAAPLDSSIGSLRAGSGVGRPTGNAGGPRGTGVNLNLKLWSSSRNSLLSPKASGAAPKQGFGVTIKAFYEAARKPAWHGIARAPDSGGDSFRAGSAMIKHLIDVLGQTIETETVSLR